MLTTVERTPPERGALIDRLVGDFGLLQLAAAVCAEADVPGREQQVAYCVAVLVGKADPARRKKGAPAERTYRLDLDADDFAERLASWAERIAHNLGAWAEAIEAIQAEADRYEITTLRGLIYTHRADDLIDRVADALLPVLADGPPPGRMSLDLLREEEPGGGDYVFQTPLPRWLATAGRRKVPARDTDMIDEEDVEAAPHDAVRRPRGGGGAALDQAVVDEIVAEGELAEGTLKRLVDTVAALSETRELLASVIERVDRWEADVARMRPSSESAAERLARLRAALTYEADALRREQGAVTGMLAFLTLSMRKSPKQQRVAVLYLRLEAIDPAAVDTLAARMRALIEDDGHPTPMLLAKTVDAAERGAVPGSRVTALEVLRRTAVPRTVELAPVSHMLDALPATVRGRTAITAIAALVGSSETTVSTNGHAATVELAAIDPLYGAVFRRFAIGRTG
jgi:hypothetical protein